MPTIRVEAGRPYSVHIGTDVFGLFNSEYKELLDSADRIVVIADEKVASLHLGHLLPYLKSYKVDVFNVPSGEQAKSIETFMDCHSFLLAAGCSRKTLILAFGGGATGDLAGFVASTFMRGIPYIQVPTTILAHDSAVGGKTAINHALGKNMIGTFYQPEAVLYDIQLLKTLPDHEWRSGMAEVIKHAFISNEQWLDELLAVESFQAMSDPELMGHLEKGIAVKAAIVEEDEFENGMRKFLNFGHTLAHALEAHLGYGNITHGEAVVLGMAYALHLSSNDRLNPFLEWGYHHGYPFEKVVEISFGELLPYMKKDKKASKGDLNFVMLRQIAQPQMEKIEEQAAANSYEELRLKIGEVIK
ncbi:3-dehydroquinate synthase [Planococcus massiliensis]|uniref:3-dehydroquinate synthase n=1 Tax=Planococcus massiliensis TaxID=1499687 RepID=A0A098ELB6_9BACL|nr:3-dehydroquinate synthase [Planococcus massiliensis]CEG22602.1 3-dehydroquinate synthase [Planococcus massiliensis]